MTARLRRQGRPRGDSEQRSIRVPTGLWPKLEKICRELNRRRDPVINGKLTPSSLVNVAVRKWLADNGYNAHSAKLYLEMTDEDDQEFAA